VQLGLLHLDDELGREGGVNVPDVGAGGPKVSVRKAYRGARIVLDDNGVPVSGQLPDGCRCQTEPVFVNLDLFWYADSHNVLRDDREYCGYRCVPA
jgi:hypothetical protein